MSSAFDFSRAMTLLCADIAARLDEFRHIRTEQMVVTFSQARSRVSHGLQAKLTPMRFENGLLTTRREDSLWTVERLFDGDREILYILSFYLPRFLDHTFHEKMVTIFHELYHINPLFNGDIRRMEGRYHVHSHSQKEYDLLMETFVEQYFSLGPPQDLYAFLKKRFRTLHARHGGIVGLRVPIPKLVPVHGSKSA